MPTYFRPQFQKHAGRVCGGVELAVTAAGAFASYRTGVELLAAFQRRGAGGLRLAPGRLRVRRRRPGDRPAGAHPRCRQAIESGDPDDLADWIAGWAADEAEFRRERQEILLYR